MSNTRLHAEWLSLVEVSGPFLSMPVLLSAFPQGLDPVMPDLKRHIAVNHEMWLESQEGRGSFSRKAKADRALHTSWIEFVLSDVLDLDEEVLVSGQALPQGLEARVPEHGEMLRPDYVVVNPQGRGDAGRPRMLISVHPLSQNLEGAVSGSLWKASPATRMMELLRATNVVLGLVTNGDRWMLVQARPQESAGFASWLAHLWLEEPVTLQAFRSLLGLHRFFSVPDDETLEALLRRSQEDQQEVTDQLGLQVRRAVEVLVRTLDRADQDAGRLLLADTPEARIYEAALTVMMRLVFLFCAEERDMLPLKDDFYEQNYAVSRLSEALRETADQHGEEVLERRYDAWCRLLATFRAVHGGVSHDLLRLPAYGGGLFDPDRFPFLEGRLGRKGWREEEADPLPVDNRTVLHLLEALQILQVRVPGGGQGEARRLSFRALDIEQIGHVYEGLLDHAAVRASELTLCIEGAKGREIEVPLSRLEETRASGKLAEWLGKETGKSAATIERALVEAVAAAAGGDGQGTSATSLAPGGLRRALRAGIDATRGRLQTLCGEDVGLFERLLPFALLVRSDSFGYPLVVMPGSVYVTRGQDRRSTGTHYTPRSLTEPIVRYTLEPLVYEGPAEGWPAEDWKLRSPQEILDLKVCDMAMGSGAFLVQACRYLSERLVEAWETMEQAHPEGPGITPGGARITPEGHLSEGVPSEQLIPADPDERLALARRLVADSCLYGVDKNPMAAEMAKLSLWLTTMQKNRPFTFLDHALKCGDSLLGLTSPEQIQHFHMDPERGKDVHLTFFDFAKVCAPALQRALEKRRKLESLQDRDIRDVEEKERLLHEAELETSMLRLLGDLIVGAALDTAGKSKEVLDRKLGNLLIMAAEMLDSRNTEEQRLSAMEPLQKWARPALDTNGHHRHPFHWCLEFPEIFDAALPAEKRGFSAIVGNPPFQGGQKITGALGTDYRDFLVQQLANGQRGSADLCAYFFLRARNLLKWGGQFGLVATNTIAQGDTREVGLDQLLKGDCVIPRAIPSRKWPGEAHLEVAHIWLRRAAWHGPFVLDEETRPEISGISASLTPPGKALGTPYRLAANQGSSFQGSNVLGLGFVLMPEEAQAVIDNDPRNREVLFPYMTGEDLNSRPDQSPSRWVINFRDWPLEKAEMYPDCMRIVREKVKPERDRLASGDATGRDRARRWWQFARPTLRLYSTIASMQQVIALSLVNNHLAFSLIPNTCVFAHKLVVFPFHDYAKLCLLQNAFHYHWAWHLSSTMRTDINYSPSDCFETFPFPLAEAGLPPIGERLQTHRVAVMAESQQGLTKLYNRFHKSDQLSTDITKLRDLHIEMDQAVAAAYGWSDLDLGHGFHETRQGVRFTISGPARSEVLDRLLALNHERYEEEVRQGLHDKITRRKVKT